MNCLKCRKEIHKSQYFCLECINKLIGKNSSFITEKSNGVLNELCKNSKNYEPFYLVNYFTNVNFTQKQLHTALYETLNSHNNNRNISIMILSKYHPDFFNYDFLFENENITTYFLHQFFYKRFLIKLVLLSFNYEILDCMKMIMDPFINKIDKPYNYVKCLLYKLLYKDQLLNNDEIPIFNNNIKITPLEYKNRDDHYLFKTYIILRYNNKIKYCVGKFIDEKIHDLNNEDIILLKTL